MGKITNDFGSNNFPASFSKEERAESLASLKIKEKIEEDFNAPFKLNSPGSKTDEPINVEFKEKVKKGYFVDYSC